MTLLTLPAEALLAALLARRAFRLRRERGLTLCNLQHEGGLSLSSARLLHADSADAFGQAVERARARGSPARAELLILAHALLTWTLRGAPAADTGGSTHHCSRSCALAGS